MATVFYHADISAPTGFFIIFDGGSRGSGKGMTESRTLFDGPAFSVYTSQKEGSPQYAVAEGPLGPFHKN